MKKLLALLLSLCLLFSLAACSSSDEGGEAEGEGGEAAGGETVEPLKIACLINGNLGDLSFFDSANAGMKMLKDELGDQVDITVTEMSYDTTKWEPALLDACDGDFDIIIVGTWQMQEILEKYADQYPEKTFILYDSSVVWDKGEFKNVHCIEYKQNEGSFLAGVLAANLTKTGTIACVGGMDNPVINDFIVGYIEGAQSVNPDIRVMSAFVGNFNDSAKATDLAAVQFSSGADVNFNIAGQAGLGVFEAAVNAGGKDAGLYVIGVDSDQGLTFKSQGRDDQAAITPTSMLKRVDISLYKAVKAYMDGTLKMGETAYMGLEEECVGLVDNELYQAAISADLQATINKAAEDIAAGTITVSSALGMPQDQLAAIINGANE
ncbi:MAG: BMP family ABC transporter substrate-binding protein [Clostridia bacterium]|nr:BMP family ABC transporter substrate-binding protein [Clostridia bacterium]